MTDNFPEYTLAEAANLRGKFVYAYRDNAAIFYIGQTINPGQRFRDNTRSYHYNLDLLKRLRESGAQVRLLVLEHDPENLLAAEQAAIIKYAKTLLNTVHNPYRVNSGLSIEPKIFEAALCAHCQAAATLRKSKYCRECLGALLGKTGGQSKQQLRELCEQVRLRGIRKTG